MKVLNYSKRYRDGRVHAQRAIVPPEHVIAQTMKRLDCVTVICRNAHGDETTWTLDVEATKRHNRAIERDRLVADSKRKTESARRIEQLDREGVTQ